MSNTNPAFTKFEDVDSKVDSNVNTDGLDSKFVNQMKGKFSNIHDVDEVLSKPEEIKECTESLLLLLRLGRPQRTFWNYYVFQWFYPLLSIAIPSILIPLAFLPSVTLTASVAIVSLAFIGFLFFNVLGVRVSNKLRPPVNTVMKTLDVKRQSTSRTDPSEAFNRYVINPLYGIPALKKLTPKQLPDIIESTIQRLYGGDKSGLNHQKYSQIIATVAVRMLTADKVLELARRAKKEEMKGITSDETIEKIIEVAAENWRQNLGINSLSSGTGSGNATSKEEMESYIDSKFEDMKSQFDDVSSKLDKITGLLSGSKSNTDERGHTRPLVNTDTGKEMSV